MDDKIKLIRKRRKSGTYNIIHHEYEMEFLIDIEIESTHKKSERTALSYFEIRYIDFSQFQDNKDQIQICTYERNFYIQGYGLRTIYDALISKRLKSISLSRDDDPESDVKIAHMFYNERDPYKSTSSDTTASTAHKENNNA